MKMIVLGDRDTVRLFQLEGMEGVVIDGAEQALDEIKRIKRSRAYGLLIVTQRVMEWGYEPITALRFSKELPLVLDIPGADGYERSSKKIVDYIREAVGIKV